MKAKRKLGNFFSEAHFSSIDTEDLLNFNRSEHDVHFEPDRIDDTCKILQTIKQKKVASVELTAEESKLINQKDWFDQTLLYIAAKRGFLAIVKLLIDIDRVNIDAANASGVTPLSIAAEKGHTEVVLALRAAGAQVDRPNNSGETPLALAVKKGHTEVVLALLAAGAQVDRSNNSSETPLFLAAGYGHAAA